MTVAETRTWQVRAELTARTALLMTAHTYDPDVHATRADLHTACAIARGTALDDIDPASGRDLSAWACRVAAESWVAYAARPARPSVYHDRMRQRAAYWRAFWAALHPDVVAAEWPVWGGAS